MKKQTTQLTIFSIYAADRKGIVGQVLIHFNNKRYDVVSLNVARTDISDVVLLTLEASIPADALGPFIERLKRIVEVYRVRTYSDPLKKNRFLLSGYCGLE